MIRTKIELMGLKTDVSIGIHDFEKQAPQPYMFDVILDVHPRLVLIEKDNIKETLNYDFVRKKILTIAKARHWNTQEALVTRLLHTFQSVSGVIDVEIYVRKTSVYPDAESVGIRVSTAH